MSTDIQDQHHTGNHTPVMSRKRQASTVHDVSGPTIRRMSRMESRPSIQYPSRRMSFASRSSISGLSWGAGQTKPVTKVANTYRMSPKADEKFNASSVRHIMVSVMESYLEGENYDKFLTTNLTKNLADVIKERMKDLGFSSRYKYVCLVTMGERREQGLAISSRCIWNTDTDNFATATLNKGNLYAVATLYALYYE